VLNNLKKLPYLVRFCFPLHVLEIEDIRNPVPHVHGVAALPALPAKPEGFRRTAEVFEPHVLWVVLQVLVRLAPVHVEHPCKYHLA